MSTFTDPLGARILIVDDSEPNVHLLEFTLRRAGYLAVSSTTEPMEVSALHRQDPYDLILLDLQMPRMNGFEVMAALAGVEDVESVAVLVLSADPSQRLAALEAGASDFLSKPFDLSEVLLRVRRLLEKRMTRVIAVPLVPAAAPAPHVLGV
jgi:DNA-binding response OmpR family regulator